MGDYHILMQFDIAADPVTVRSALATQEAIASWWSSRVALDTTTTPPQLRVWFVDQPQPFEFDVTGDGPDRVEWRTGSNPPWWAGTSIRWDLAPGPDGVGGTRLLFSHRHYTPDNPVIPIVTPVWAQIILRLKGYAETGLPQPFFAF